MSNLIEEFLERYIREYDYYCEAAKICYQLCEEKLQKAGIRAIVTYRGKYPKSLKEKLQARNERKNYKSLDDIYKDIIDLSAVRVAVYFPNSMNDIKNIFKKYFNILKEVQFPKSRQKSHPCSRYTNRYQKRFQGYVGRHFHINLKEESLPSDKKRFAFTTIEIQVASIMMHAWAEVEHDLVYKPKSGDLSTEELEILDEINGIALKGDEALQRLYNAGDKRLLEPDSKIKNAYELSALIHYFIDKLKDSEDWDIEPGEVENLTEFLVKSGINTYKQLKFYFDNLKREERNNSITDNLLSTICYYKSKENLK